MAWSVWYESNQKRFEVDSGFGLGTRLCLNSSVISGMTDEEIVEVARWFVGHAREIDAIHTDDMSMAEAILHKSFTDKRVKGEWFELALEDIEAIKAITAYRNGIFIKG